MAAVLLVGTRKPRLAAAAAALVAPVHAAGETSQKKKAEDEKQMEEQTKKKDQNAAKKLRAANKVHTHDQADPTIKQLNAAKEEIAKLHAKTDGPQVDVSHTFDHCNWSNQPVHSLRVCRCWVRGEV